MEPMDKQSYSEYLVNIVIQDNALKYITEDVIEVTEVTIISTADEGARKQRRRITKERRGKMRTKKKTKKKKNMETRKTTCPKKYNKEYSARLFKYKICNCM